MEQKEDPIFITVDLDIYLVGHRKIIEENYSRLPLMFNDLRSPFAGINHLNALYKESYFCILHGLYHSGIVVMTQLIEETLREIIRINTGTPHQGTLDQLIGFVNKTNETSDKYLIHPELLAQITEIKNRVRNPYSHLRYKDIFKGKTTPVAKIKFQIPSEEGIEQKIQNSVEEERVTLHELDLGIEPSISAIFKENYDKQLAFKLCWEIYALYWLLLEEYLTLDKYENYCRTVGSFVEKLPPLKRD